MVRLLLVMVPLVALGGCKTENKGFCDNPANAGLMGCPGDASNGGGCGSDGDCQMAGFPACDLTINQGTCEQCTSNNHSACKDTTPRCEKDTCVACVDDVQDCQGGVCLAGGDCAAASRIIHAASTSTKMPPCGDTTATACSLTGALMAVAPGKNVIKLDDQGPFTALNGFTVSNDVTIDARGATLNSAGNGAVVTVMGGKSLTLLGGTIHGTAGKDGDGISCSGAGSTLVAVDTKVENNDQSGIGADTCTLNLTRVTISNNSQKAGTFVPGIDVNKGSITLAQSRIDSNNGGGLSITGATVFQIVGNVFSNNGPPGVPSPPSTIGGIFIMTTGDPANRLDFNTITGSHAQPGNGPGLQCTANSLVVRNNIIYNNNDNLVAQFGGNCQPTYSDLGFITVDTSNNTHVDPMFGTGFHLNASSLLLGKADPTSDLGGIASKDIDGEPRVKRNGMGADIGADQYYPPGGP